MSLSLYPFVYSLRQCIPGSLVIISSVGGTRGADDRILLLFFFFFASPFARQTDGFTVTVADDDNGVGGRLLNLNHTERRRKLLAIIRRLKSHLHKHTKKSRQHRWSWRWLQWAGEEEEQEDERELLSFFNGLFLFPLFFFSTDWARNFESMVRTRFTSNWNGASNKSVPFGRES